MESFKIVVFIMAILISLTAIANKRKLPYPVLLVLAGLVIGFVPHLPNLASDELAISELIELKYPLNYLLYSSIFI